MRKKVVIEEELKFIDDYITLSTYERSKGLNDTDYLRSHYDILDVIERLIEGHEYKRQQAIVFAQKHRNSIIELMTLNGLNPYDAIDTIRRSGGY